MWQNPIHKKAYWMCIDEDFKKMLAQLMVVERDEESDLFRFELHLRDEAEIAVFSSEEQKVIQNIYKELMTDTRRHTKTILKICDILNALYERETGGKSCATKKS